MHCISFSLLLLFFFILHLRHKARGCGEQEGEGYYCNRVSYYRHEKKSTTSTYGDISLAVHPSIDPDIQPIIKRRQENILYALFVLS